MWRPMKQNPFTQLWHAAMPLEQQGLQRSDASEVLGRHYLSNATCLMQASIGLCVLRRVKDHHNSPSYSPILKKTCVRQAVLNKWFPLRYLRCVRDFEEGHYTTLHYTTLHYTILCHAILY